MSPQPNYLARARARRAKEARRFGHQPAACLFCGPLPYAALVDPAIAHRLFELHHIVGYDPDPDLVVSLCRNCHYALSMGMLDVGWTARVTPPNPVVTTDQILRALAAFFKALAEACLRYAERLAAGISQLDGALPTWRAVLEGSSHA